MGKALPDIFCELILLDSQTFVTKTCPQTNDLEWEDTFVEKRFTIVGTSNDPLSVRVNDRV